MADAAAAAVGAGGPNPYPGDDATKAQIAAWMGREAEKRGLPKQLPVMASLVESGVRNLHFGDADSVGFYQMRVGIWNKGEYAGFPDKPELQVKWFLDQAEAVKKQRIAAGKSVTDPNQFGDWIADVERPAEQYRGRYGLRLGEANGLLGQAGSAPPPAAVAAAAAAPAPGAPAAAAAALPPEPKPGDSGQFMAAADRVVDAKKGGSGSFLAVQPPAGPAERGGLRGIGAGHGRRRRRGGAGSGSSTLGASALSFAQTQLGVHETGVNSGAEVDKYLAAAGVGPGNPWCASFVTYSLQQAGHKMPGSGWAAVSTWVQHAEAKQNNLQIVSADQARPGDIVAYDWGHQDDFGSDGHIGFLASNVQDGKFTALEGNNHDAVMKVPRDVNMANVKFIRIGGDAPPPAGAAVPEAAAPGGVADAAAQAVGGGGGGSLPGRLRVEGTARRVDGPRGGEARAAQAAAGHGLARRVGREEPQLRRRRLGRLLPDARRDLEPGRLRGLPREARAAGEVVPRPGRGGQEAADRARPVGHRPQGVRQLDRRHRAPRRAVPRPLRAAPRRGQRAARPRGGRARGGAGRRRRRRRQPSTPRRRPPRAAVAAAREPARSRRSPRPRSTRASRTSGAARRRRPASTAPGSRSGRTRRRASRSRA